MKETGEFSMNTKFDLSVILVNYNGKKYIDVLFQSLKKLKHNDFTYQVVFVDNASSDDSVEYLRNQNYGADIPIKIVLSEENRGFAGGNNLGVREAEGKYIVFLNNDTAVDEMWLQELYHFFIRQDNCVMANSKLLFFYDYMKVKFKTSDKIVIDRTIMINDHSYYADGKFIKNCLCEEKELVCFGHTEIMLPLIDGVTDYTFTLKTKNWHIGSDAAIVDTEYDSDEDGNVHIHLSQDYINQNKITLIQNAGSGMNDMYNGYDIGFCEPDSEKYQKPYEINNGCGAAIIMKKEDFQNCGGFDEQFFMYYEDTDLSYRMKKGGKKIMYCPTSIVRHIHTGSSTEWSPFFTYHVYRNKLLYLYKNISKTQFFIYYIRQYIDGLRNRDESKKRACRDAYKIAFGKKEDIHY